MDLNSLTTVCQLHMLNFRDGDILFVGPWCAAAFPVIRDLVVCRSAFDRIIAAGTAPDANALSVP